MTVAGNSWADCSKELARSRQSGIPVFVVTESAEGFTQPKQTADSTKDLIRSLKGKGGICLAENRVWDWARCDGRGEDDSGLV